MNRDDATTFRHVERLRVRYVEVDAQRIVFNGHYLAYIDVALAGYWRAMALPWEATLRTLGGELYVRRAALDYRAPARFDDVLDIGLRCERVGRSSIVFAAAVMRAGERLVDGELVYVFADPRGRESREVPASLRGALADFEAGREMVELKVGAWRELGGPAGALRQAVFVQEQGIPAALEWDAEDERCVHAVVLNRLGAALATGRLLAPAPSVGKIGRMAVERSLRGSGLGRRVLDALVEAARARGDRQVLLHAQASAVAFYRGAGFTEHGEPFVEAGIPHQEMVRAL